MQFIFDAHIHSSFSVDGKSSVEDYINEAAKIGVDALGFTEHIDFLPECGSYGFLDSADYIEHVKSLQVKGEKVFAGAEIDFVSEEKENILDHLRKYKYDYIVSSVHMINRRSISDGVIKGFLSESELSFFIDNYYSEIKESIILPGVYVMGHLGIYKRQMWRYISQFPTAVKKINEYEDEIAVLCVRLNIIVEVNASALFSDYGEPLADEAFLRRYYAYGGRRVTIGSDAHQAESLYRGVMKSIDLLRAAGFSKIITPWNGQIISII